MGSAALAAPAAVYPGKATRISCKRINEVIEKKVEKGLAYIVMYTHIRACSLRDTQTFRHNIAELPAVFSRLSDIDFFLPSKLEHKPTEEMLCAYSLSHSYR